MYCSILIRGYREGRASASFRTPKTAHAGNPRRPPLERRVETLERIARIMRGI